MGSAAACIEVSVDGSENRDGNVDGVSCGHRRINVYGSDDSSDDGNTVGYCCDDCLFWR